MSLKRKRSLATNEMSNHDNIIHAYLGYIRISGYKYGLFFNMLPSNDNGKTISDVIKLPEK